MANLSLPNTFSKFSNTSMGEGIKLSDPVQVSSIINLIFNGITCPLTVLLNVLVIMAVKRRRRLQSNSNILLACLAATDAFTGLLVQPSFILVIILKLCGTNNPTITIFHNTTIRVAFVISSLHLILVTFERLMAIKFTMYYPYVITKQNIKVAVIVFWVTALSILVLRQMVLSNILAALSLFSCVLFVVISYVILYRETRRHEKKIKTQQLPQEEVERFTKESKALKTTVFVVGAIVLCLLPSTVFFLSVLLGLNTFWRSGWFPALAPSMRTCGMLNSLLNPLIYCWRQQEMRKFVFRFSRIQEVHPAN